MNNRDLLTKPNAGAMSQTLLQTLRAKYPEDVVEQIVDALGKTETQEEVDAWLEKWVLSKRTIQ